MLRLEEFGYEVTERGLPSPTSLAKNFARTGRKERGLACVDGPREERDFLHPGTNFLPH